MPWKFPKTDYGKRTEFYDDIESLISPGFLSETVSVGKAQISVRSLYPSDLFLLEHRVGRNLSDTEWKSWCIATCVWMVDGVLILGEPHATNRVKRIIHKLPDPALDLLFSLILGFSNRVNRAVDGVEAYCYEGVSRLQWKQYGKSLPNMDSVVGIPGVERLGLNTVQKIWMAFNFSEDERLQDQTTWESAKLVASASAPKGVEKLNQKDEARFRREDERRQDLLDFWFYKNIGYLSDEDLDHRSKMRGIQYAQTVDELEDEYRRWITGEFDHHDKIVQAYKDQIRQQIADEQEERAKAWEEVRSNPISEEESMPAIPLVGFTPEQVQKIIQQRRITGKSGARFIHESNNPKQELIYDKFLSRKQSSPWVGVEGGRMQEQEPGSLQDRVAGRNLTLNEDGEING